MFQAPDFAALGTSIIIPVLQWSGFLGLFTSLISIGLYLGSFMNLFNLEEIRSVIDWTVLHR